MPTCPACLNDDFERRVLLPRIRVEQCRTCNLFISDITPGAAVEAEFARINSCAYHDSVGVVRQRQAKQVLALVKKHGNGKDWLDVGCGFGYFLDEARRAGFNVLGIEPDDSACAQAKSLLGAQCVR